MSAMLSIGVKREAVASGVRAVVFVGDAMEEAVDVLCAKAGELGLLKVIRESGWRGPLSVLVSVRSGPT